MFFTTSRRLASCVCEVFYETGTLADAAATAAARAPPEPEERTGVISYCDDSCTDGRFLQEQEKGCPNKPFSKGRSLIAAHVFAHIGSGREQCPLQALDAQLQPTCGDMSPTRLLICLHWG